MIDIMDRSTPLGRFGHHDNPAIDFVHEVDAITSAPYMGDQTLVRIQTAMQFRVGGDADAVEAKNRLRKLEDDAVHRKEKHRRQALERDLASFLTKRVAELDGKPDDPWNAASDILDFLERETS